MQRLIWEPIKLGSKRYRHGEALISMSKKEGRIFISSEACKLIPNIYTYHYVEPLKARGADGGIIALGLRFTNVQTSTALTLRRPRYKGEPTGGCIITSKPLIRALFGTVGDLKTAQYPAEKYSDDTLMVLLKAKSEKAL